MSSFHIYRKKLNMERGHAKNTRSVDERSLFHGTDTFDTCYGICTNSFDFRLSGKNATVYGKGSYFAVSAMYSNGYTNGPTRLMFQAKVLIGSYTRGTQDMTCPPIIPGEGHKRYDSCVNDSTNPSIFVIFDRSQCYPEYLIAYNEINVESSVDTAVSFRPSKPAATTFNHSALGTSVGYSRNSQSYFAFSNLLAAGQPSTSFNVSSSQTPAPKLVVPPSSSSFIGNSTSNQVYSPRSLSNVNNQQSSAPTRSQSYSATSYSHTSNQASTSFNASGSQNSAPKPMVTSLSAFLRNSNPTTGQTNSLRSLSNVNNQQSGASTQSQVSSSIEQPAHRRPSASTARSSGGVYPPVKKNENTCPVQ
jgi:poly [ADP-ribose] polymerase 7/11/12/13